MKKYSKNFFFIILIVISLIVSVIIGIQRIGMERNFEKVELVMSLIELRGLSLQEDLSEEELLKGFREKGLSSIAIHEDTIETLLKRGQVAFLNANDVALMNLGDAWNLMPENKITSYEHLLICKDYLLFSRIKENLILALRDKKVQSLLPFKDYYILKLSGDPEQLFEIGLGFSDQDIQMIRGLGYNVILRPRNPDQLDEKNIRQKITHFEKIKNISAIVFDAEEVIGYPSAKMMNMTADYLSSQQIPIGIIEFTEQKGIQNIAQNMSHLAIRVHSITKEEMEVISSKKAIDRWIRAAKERNVRLFYIKPFLKQNHHDIIAFNNSYIERIKKQLIDAGFSTGQASLFETYQIPTQLIYLLNLGIIAAGVLFITSFFKLNQQQKWILFAFAFLFTVLIQITLGRIMLMKLLALGSALIFPSLAIIKNKKFLVGNDNVAKNTTTTNNNAYFDLIKKIIVANTRIAFFALIGGIFIGAVLADYSFVLAIERFSGIKIAYIFPLLFIMIYFWWHSKNDKLKLIEDLQKPILFEHAMLAFILLVFVVIYISRSGNFSFLPVPEIEEKMRVFLEEVLIARP